LVPRDEDVGFGAMVKFPTQHFNDSIGLRSGGSVPLGRSNGLRAPSAAMAIMVGVGVISRAT